MKAPDIIYLQTCGDCRNHELCPNECEECKFDDNEVTWCKDQIFDTDRVYFSEDAVRRILLKYQLSENIVEELKTGMSFAEQMKYKNNT